MVLSAIGLFSTLVLHLASVFKLPFEHFDKVFYLAGGVFVVWLPTVLVVGKLTKEFKRKDFWKAAMRGCPPWIKKLAYVVFGYAVINFIYMMITGPDENNISTARFVSGHLLPFYAVAFATLYSATKVDEMDSTRRCINGHPVSPGAKYCEECGAAVQSDLK